MNRRERSEMKTLQEMAWKRRKCLAVEGTGDCRSSREFKIRDADNIMCWRNFEGGETATGRIEKNGGTC